MSEVPWVEAAALGPETAHATWALAARMLLEETAGRYHGVVSHDELADYCQERTRIRTGGSSRHWIGDVLWRVMQDNQAKGEPFLSALAVSASGRVWSGYAGCVAHLRGREPGDPDQQAAEERLSCYRWWGADLPDGGGVPGPLPAAAAPRRAAPARGRSTSPASPGTGRESRPARSPSPRVARSDVVPAICPRCFMALPASGQCDNCD